MPNVPLTITNYSALTACAFAGITADPLACVREFKAAIVEVHDRAARITGRERYRSVSAYGALVDYERASDLPGIAAARRPEPTPEPVLSVAGQQVTESELAAALKLIREKNAPPPEPQAPIGLMFCDESFDHRLGRWNEA